MFNTPDVLTESVADLALFLILAAARDTTAAERTLRARRWGPWAPTSMLGRSLQGSRLGIFGMGRIGQAIAVRAQAFGMHLHYHNRSRLPADRELGGVFHDGLEDLLAESDVYRNEPHIDERWLGLPNATLLPHIGSATQEVRTAMGMLALGGIESHFNGEPAANLLNPGVYG